MVAVLDSASGDSASPTSEPAPPGIAINQPDNRSIVRQGSFEISGRLSGSVDDVEVAIDGVSLGNAVRAQDGGWRIPATRVSVEAGFHVISATARGEGGRDTAEARILFDTSLAWDIVVKPESTEYSTEDFESFVIPVDPDVILLTPAGEGIRVDTSVTAPQDISAELRPEMLSVELFPGDSARLDIEFDSLPPGQHPVQVTATDDEGATREATYTINVTGPGPTSTTLSPATTSSPFTAPPGAIFDDFEGGDLWTAATTTATNGAAAEAIISTGGNPAGFRDMIHTLPGTDDGQGNPTRIVVRHTFTDAGWDPGTNGPLRAIRYSEDQIMIDPPFDGAAVGTLFIVFQGSAEYTATVNLDSVFTNTDWQTRSVTLTSGDFSPSPGPDFSTGGAPMTFGMLRSNTHRGSLEIVVRHGIDNWTVEPILE